jgi:hypothetical protein
MKTTYYPRWYVLSIGQKIEIGQFGEPWKTAEALTVLVATQI